MFLASKLFILSNINVQIQVSFYSCSTLFYELGVPWTRVQQTISCRFDTYAFQMAHSALGPVFLRDVMIRKVLSFDNQSC